MGAAGRTLPVRLATLASPARTLPAGAGAHIPHTCWCTHTAPHGEAIRHAAVRVLPHPRQRPCRWAPRGRHCNAVCVAAIHGTTPLAMVQTPSGVESRQLLIQVQQQGNGLRTTYRYNLWPQDWAVMLMYLCFFTGLWLCCSRLVGKDGWPGQPLNSGRRHIGAFTPPQPCLGLLRGSHT